MTTKQILLIPIFGFLLLQTACTATLQEKKELTKGDYSYLQEHISHQIKKIMKDKDIVGLSIAVVDDQEIVWADGFGWADKQNKIRARPETVYRVGSITKLFTATAAMQLAEQGKLDINQPLEKILQQFAIKSHLDNTAPITPRNIMTHHSGLQGNYLHGMWTEKPEDFTGLTLLLKDEYTAYQPDTVFSYSNLGMTLLGHAVQEVSGRPYSEQIRQELLIPIGMTDSYIAKELDNSSQSSKGYADKKEANAIPLRDLPAGGLNSTVLDLARFTQMIFSDGRVGKQQIIQEETLREMLSFQDGDAPFDLGQQMIGLGWFLDTQLGDKAGVRAVHGGSTFLFHSLLMTLPKHRLAVIVLANSDSAADVVNDIAEDAIKLALEIKTGIKVSDNDELSVKAVPAKAADLGTFPGYYSTPAGLVEIKRKGDKLQVIVNDDTLELVRHENNLFYLQYKILGIFPVDLEGLEKLGISRTEIAEHEILTAEHQGQRMVIGSKIVAQTIPESWKNRVGEYEVINQQRGIKFKEIALIIKNDLLLLKVGIQLPHQSKVEETGQVVLMAKGDQMAVIHGLNADSGETIRVVQQNGEELLAYSGFLLRHVQ